MFFAAYRSSMRIISSYGALPERDSRRKS